MKLAIAICVLALTGCTVERTIVEPAATSTTRVVEQKPQSLGIDEEGFIAFIESETGPLLVPESSVLETGYMVCDTARKGATYQEFEEMIYSSADDYEGRQFLTYITASALAFLCPGVMERMGTA